MEAGTGSLKDCKNMAKARTCGVEQESTKGCKVCLESVLAEGGGKKNHVSPPSNEQWKSGQVHKNLNAFLS